MTIRANVYETTARGIGRFVLMLALILLASPAFATCPGSPVGNEGDLVYNATYHLMQYCNGTMWINMGSLNISGTTNYVAKYTGNASLGSSLMYDSGIGVGIGTTMPANTLDLAAGSIHIGNSSPVSTLNALYAIGTSLMWNGSTVGAGSGGSNNVAGSGTAWVMVGSTDISTATTSFSFNGSNVTGGLNGDTDGEYQIVTRIVSGNSAATAFSIEPNADAAVADYGYEQLYGNSTTASAANVASNAGMYMGYSYNAAGQLSTSTSYLYAKSGQARTMLTSFETQTSGATVYFTQIIDAVWTNSANPITSLQIVSSTANGLGVGTHLELWAKRNVGGTPTAGGSNTNVQFNNNGVIGGDGGFTYAGSSGVVAITGMVGIGTTTPANQLDVYSGGIHIGNSTPASTANALYAIGTSLIWNGVALSGAGSGGGKLLGIYASGAAASNYTMNFTGAANSTPSLSGSTLTLPNNTAYFTVEIWGGGGGGSNGTAGSTSCFGTNATACTSPLVSASGGGLGGGSPYGVGGTGSGGDINLTGNAGQAMSGSGAIPGGAGGSAPRGGGGGSGPYGTTGSSGSSFGGGGGGQSGSASGGGGGGYASKLITSATGTYYYTIGGGGTAGTSAGAGGPGGIEISVYTSGSGSGSSSSPAGSNTQVQFNNGGLMGADSGLTYAGSSGTVAVAGSLGVGTATPQTSAQIDVTSTTKGMLPPRMTSAQRDAIASPAAGLIIFNTTTSRIEFYNGTAWTSFQTQSSNAGQMVCWGYNVVPSGASYAQEVMLSPTAIYPSPSFTVISPNDYYSCGVTSSGTAYCWGDNPYGGLGNGTTTSQGYPSQINSSQTFASVSVSGYWHACGVTTTGAGYCWGYNNYSQCGNNSTTNALSPVLVNGAYTWKQISTGTDGSCGVTTSGVGYCWGYNGYGQIGDGTTTNRTVPTAVSGGYTWANMYISSSYYDSAVCGVTTGNVGYCWGANNYGQVGDNTTTSRSVPTAVSGGLAWSKIIPGGFVTCGLTTAGAAYCWGTSTGDGQLGNGTTNGSAVPVAVSGGLTFTDIVVLTGGACGITSTGTVYCWGYNYVGSVGNGTETVQTTPVAVNGNYKFSKLFGGGEYYENGSYWYDSVCGIVQSY